MREYSALKWALRVFAPILFALGTTHVLAQSITIPEPRIRETTDELGVDLVSGLLTIADGGLSIGELGGGGLSHTRYWMGSQGWRHGFFLSISTVTGGVRVNVGPSSTTFTLSGGTYSSDQGDGATLIETGTTFIYTSRDGTVITFDKTLVANGTSYYGIVLAVGTTILLPNGEKETLTYKNGNYTLTVCIWTCFDMQMYLIRLQSVTNNAGYQLRFEYASNTLPSPTTTVTTANDWVRQIKVTGVNNAIDYCDSAADSCSYGYGSWPYLTYASSASGSNTFETVTDPLGRQTRYTVNGSGQLIAVKRPGKSTDTMQIGYSNGSVIQLSKEALTRTYNWNLNAGILTVTTSDSLSGISRTRTVKSNTTYLARTEDTNHSGKTTLFTLDAKGRTTEIRAPELNKIQYTYDTRGNITQAKAIAKTAGSPADIVESWTYDASCSNPKTCNKPNTYTDPRGKVTNYSYDATHGGVTSVKLPAPGGSGNRPETRTTWTALYAYYKNSGGSIVQAATSIYKVTAVSSCATGVSPGCLNTLDETRTVFGYGSTGVANNRALASTTVQSGTGSLAATTTLTRNQVRDVTSVDGPLSSTADSIDFYRDAARQVTLVVTPDPDSGGPLRNRAIKYTYNNDGQVTLMEQGTANSDGSVFIPLQKRQSTYDGWMRKVKDELLSSAGAAQAVTEYSYDAASRSICTAVRMNSAVWGSLPAVCSQSTNGTFGPDRITRNNWNGNNQVTSVESGVGSTLAQTTVTNTYTDNGKLDKVKDAKNNQTDYTYDGFDRLIKTNYPSLSTPNTSSTTDYEEFGYDAGSNMTGFRNRANQTANLTYDALNRLTFKFLPGGADVNYGYDLMGRLTSVWTGAMTLSYVYDSLGRVTRQTSPQGNTDYQYDAAGRKTRLTWPDNFYVDYDWLVSGDLSKIRENGATTGIGVLATFTYDDLGRRTYLTRGNGTSTSYGFNAASQLASLTQNLAGTTTDITTTYTYNPAFQITQRVRGNDYYVWSGVSSVNRNYAANGLNQYTTSGSVTPTYDTNANLTSAGTQTYQYDFENRLFSAANPTATLEYDPLGRLSRTTGTSTYRLGYDGDDLIAEYNDSNGLLRRYVHGPGSDEPLVWYEGSGTADRYWLHADERGSIIAISNASGAKFAINAYDEYGVPHPGNVGRFGYTGQQWLPDLGMYYYKARVYSATLGRFLQTDPLSYGAGDMNLYAYVGNDPLNKIDPSGMDWQCSSGYSSYNVYSYGADGMLNISPGYSSWNVCAYFPDVFSPYGGGGSSHGSANTGAPGNGREGEEMKWCPFVPEAPPGVNVDDNIDIAKDSSWINPGALKGMISNVENYGVWDYKRQGRQYENFGNFNFGAVTAAMGMPSYVAQNGAGVYQQWKGEAAAGSGTPITTWPFGDASSDADQIERGRQYVQNGCHGVPK